MNTKTAVIFIVLAFLVGGIGVFLLQNIDLAENTQYQQTREADINQREQYATQQFNEIAKEIDYWYEKPDGSIGKAHYDQLIQRLDDMEGKIAANQIEEHKARLNEMVLAQQPSLNQQNENDPSNSNQNQQNQAQYNTESKGCDGTGPVQFTFPPRRLEDIEFFTPMGIMIGNHVTPVDHGYFYPPNWKPEPTLAGLSDVLIPADGVITSIGRMPTYFSMKGEGIEDYRIVVHHSCTFFTVYIHVLVLSPQIKEKIGEIQSGNTMYPAIPVNAGDILGRASTFDFSVHDEEVTLSGFIVPEHYEREKWKIHTIDPLESFIEPLRTQLQAKSLRSVKPYGGKIDQDIDGTLQGNWFVENTNGYQGVKQPEYWETHVSFSPDMLDENHFIISLGGFNGEALQFSSKSNSPLPRSVNTQSGLVKYELVTTEYTIGNSNQYWDRLSLAHDLKAQPGSEVKGVVLVEMLEDRRMKLEVFAGKTASQVSGFSSAAKFYER
ncbi:hypothetical protein HYV86_01590 [Candidatus Woesearchaeota archaeon]|nr:hypothetical protein [Candidatus Woesearchaeota archaeon]